MPNLILIIYGILQAPLTIRVIAVLCILSWTGVNLESVPPNSDEFYAHSSLYSHSFLLFIVFICFAIFSILTPYIPLIMRIRIACVYSSVFGSFNWASVFTSKTPSAVDNVSRILGWQAPQIRRCCSARPFVTIRQVRHIDYLDYLAPAHKVSFLLCRSDHLRPLEWRCPGILQCRGG